MGFINALANAAKREGVSPSKLYSKRNGGDMSAKVETSKQGLEKPRQKSPFKGMTSYQLYMQRPLD